MAVGMQDYEQEIAACKRRLFTELFQSDIQELLEVGMGTGPNMRYYEQQQVKQAMADLLPATLLCLISLG